MRGYQYKVATTPLHTEKLNTNWKRRKRRKKNKRAKKGKNFRRPDYFEYIQSIQWKKVASRLKQKHGRCHDCLSKYNLTVHHLTYKRLGKEKENDLIVLCWPCHQFRHEDKMDISHLQSIRKEI